MTTTTSLEYAVQVQLTPGDWTFVVETDHPDEVQVHQSLDSAVQMIAIWKPGGARLLTRIVTRTDWRVNE
jgi:hypothetical protein